MASCCAGAGSYLRSQPPRACARAAAPGSWTRLRQHLAAPPINDATPKKIAAAKHNRVDWPENTAREAAGDLHPHEVNLLSWPKRQSREASWVVIGHMLRKNATAPASILFIRRASWPIFLELIVFGLRRSAI